MYEELVKKLVLRLSYRRSFYIIRNLEMIIYENSGKSCWSEAVLFCSMEMTTFLLKKLYLVFGYEIDILLSSEIPESSVDMKSRAFSLFQPIFHF